ncbi:MAG: hypothetical protein U0269_09210 [Polyangiales bacterium]
MSDDPFDPSVLTAAQDTAWAAPAADASMVVRDVEQTIVMEGSSEPPSTLKMQEATPLGKFQAIIGASSPRARSLFAALATVAALGLALAIAMDGPRGEPVCAVMSLVAMALFPLRAAWLWALSKHELELSATRFSAVSRGVLGLVRHEFDARTIHGFGYQRHPTRPWRYQLVVVLRSGWTAAIDIACSRRDEVRFVARRLNAELALLQAKK